MRSSILLLLLVVACAQTGDHTISLTVGDGDALQFTGPASSSILAATQAEHGVQTEHYALGDFVIAIDGISANATHYWALYVDGTYASRGADAISIGDVDTVVWRMEEITGAFS